MKMSDRAGEWVEYHMRAGNDWVKSTMPAEVAREAADRAVERRVDEEGMLVCDGKRRFDPALFVLDEGEELEREAPRKERRGRKVSTLGKR